MIESEQDQGGKSVEEYLDGFRKLGRRLHFVCFNMDGERRDLYVPVEGELQDALPVARRAVRERLIEENFWV